MSTIYKPDFENGIVLMHIYNALRAGQSTVGLKCTAIFDLEDLDRVVQAGTWHGVRSYKYKSEYWQVRNGRGLYLTRCLLRVTSVDNVKVQFRDKNSLNYRQNNLKIIRYNL